MKVILSLSSLFGFSLFIFLPFFLKFSFKKYWINFLSENKFFSHTIYQDHSFSSLHSFQLHNPHFPILLFRCPSFLLFFSFFKKLFSQRGDANKTKHNGKDMLKASFWVCMWQAKRRASRSNKQSYTCGQFLGVFQIRKLIAITYKQRTWLRPMQALILLFTSGTSVRFL